MVPGDLVINYIIEKNDLFNTNFTIFALHANCAQSLTVEFSADNHVLSWETVAFRFMKLISLKI